MSDLFNNGFAATAIDLPDAELTFLTDFLSPTDADRLLVSLLEEIEWKESEVFVWGKWHKQPRLVAWYGDEDATYSYSGSSMTALAWTSVLDAIRRRVEEACDASFNSVLLNLYRDGNDRMGWHSDNEPELRSTIGSVSLGESRTLLFRHRTDKSLGTRKIELTHGSLLKMAGTTQQFWQHAINKEAKVSGPRINLTFRYVDPSRRGRKA